MIINISIEPVDESLVLENTFRGLKPLADEISAEIYKATLKDGAKSATIKATTTTKTWDDGVPVLKYLARGRAKSISFDFDLRPFTVLHDYAHGWFYFTDGRKWYGLHTDDGYDEPSDLPFDMEISDVVVESVEINEGRSINKIKKDYDKVINDMAERVKSWKECKASGDSKGEAECLAELKELTSKKKALMSELDAAVGIKDIDAELAEAFIGEARSWGTFGTPEAKKVIKQMDKSWDKFSKTVSRAHADFRSDVKSIINSEDGSKSGILDSEGGSYITGMVNNFARKEFMMDDLGDISRYKYMIELYEAANIEALDEGIKHGSYVFTNRYAFQAFDDALPAKGESCFCVFLHNSVEINGEQQYLGSNGGGLQSEVLGLFADEAEAKEAYDNAVSSKKTGEKLSVTMGTLVSKTKFRFDYSEIEGYTAKGTIK